ncbi:hypothetical protein SY83_01950 [Paenibacillus swuensis]|uniref:DUF3934 domain-containing protein n=1 Tax=Paenibacillus swuensis TaxID=1178515 RepID=A0A172TEH6_9BACL|nr:DUF3934 family protein [Paenibacillus swuensis]ANE45297.1 hypothetical protein SY83_01950 [Paenibacillus swuensis]
MAKAKGGTGRGTDKKGWTRWKEKPKKRVEKPVPGAPKAISNKKKAEVNKGSRDRSQSPQNKKETMVDFGTHK